MRFLHDFEKTGSSSGKSAIRSSIVAEDHSVYVGSCRYSYDRVNHVPEMHRLKLNHVPLYLQGRGFVAADLPSTHSNNDMSVRDWIVWSQEHFVDRDLHVHDVFPTANTGDWVIVDAPVPTLQAWANGADADINTLETEMDAAEASIGTLETEMNAAEASIGTLETEMNAAEASIGTLETEMDAAEAAITALEAGGGGGGVSTRFDFEANNTQYPQLSVDSVDVIWTRSGGGSNGGAMSYELPATADMENGHTIHVHCFQQHHSSSNGGTVFFKRKSDQAFVSASFNHPQITAYQSNTCYISNVDRSSYALHFHKNSGIANWYLRCTSNTNLLHSNEVAITTNTDSISKQRYFKFFPADQTGYVPTSGNHFTLPDGYSEYQIVYGDGMEDDANLVNGIWLNLPENPSNGTTVRHCTLMNYNSTTNHNVVTIDFSGTSNQPTNRRLIDDHVEYVIGGNMTALVEGHSTATGTGRKETVFYYVSSIDTWCHRLASY